MPIALVWDIPDEKAVDGFGEGAWWADDYSPVKSSKLSSIITIDTSEMQIIGNQLF